MTPILAWILAACGAGMALLVILALLLRNRLQPIGEFPHSGVLAGACLSLMLLGTICTCLLGLMIHAIIYDVNASVLRAFVDSRAGGSAIVGVAVFYWAWSLLYSTRQSFREPGRPRKVGIAPGLAVSGILFALMTGMLCLLQIDAIAGDLAIAAAGVAIVHVFRIGLDLFDAADRLGPGSWRRSVNEVELPALLFDAGANLCVIWFSIAALAWHGRSVLFGLVAFSGFFMVGKELKFRLWDGLLKRARAPVASSKGGTAGVSRPEIRLAQLFFGQFLKSYFYIVVGFALIYLAAGRLGWGAPRWAEYASGADAFVDAVWLSVGILNSTFPAKLPLAIQVIALFEAAIQPILLGLVLGQLLSRPVPGQIGPDDGNPPKAAGR